MDPDACTAAPPPVSAAAGPARIGSTAAALAAVISMVASLL
jgi:hypothetical protein